MLGTALGLLASGFARTEFQAVQFMPALVLPQFLLCGLLVPRELLPPVLEAISNVLPLSYAVDAMKDVTALADPLSEVLPSLGVIAAVDRRCPSPSAASPCAAAPPDAGCPGDRAPASSSIQRPAAAISDRTATRAGCSPPGGGSGSAVRARALDRRRCAHAHPQQRPVPGAGTRAQRHPVAGKGGRSGPRARRPRPG